MNSYLSLTLVTISCFSWTASAFFPSANKGGVTCVDPIVPNGDHTPRAWFTWKHSVFTVLTFKCSEAYELQGPKTARCQLTGKWTELPSCVLPPGVLKPVFCNLPAIGDNVEVYPTKLKYRVDEIVRIVCPVLRKSESIAISVCGSDGQFYPALPKCSQPRCIPPEIPSNGRLSPNKASFAVGEVVGFECNEGFKLTGSENTTCGVDGYFPWTKSECERTQSNEAYCRRPVTRRGQVFSPDKHQYLAGENISFSCSDGYNLSGSPVVECLLGGEWADSAPVCKEIICDRPEDPSHGRIINAKAERFFFIGQSVWFACDFGYDLVGLASCECGKDGKFRPKAPTCQKSISDVFRYKPYKS